jgi:hypothetical protein
MGPYSTKPSNCNPYERILLIAADSGKIEYVSPAAFDPGWPLYFDGKYLVAGGSGGLHDNACPSLGLTSLESREQTRWVRIDTERLTIERALPEYVSPDGLYRVKYEPNRLRIIDTKVAEVEVTNGGEHVLYPPAQWFGAHRLEVREGFTRVALDLQTLESRPLAATGHHVVAWHLTRASLSSLTASTGDGPARKNEP